MTDDGSPEATSGSDTCWTPGPDHPSPLPARSEWHDLNGRWEFAFDDDRDGVSEGWQRREDVFDRNIEVLFPFESRASGIGDTGFHPVVWSRREAEIFAQPDTRVLIHFGAVDHRAPVRVNGHAVAYHEGGNTPFAPGVTWVLDPSGHQVIVVRSEDQPLDLRQPVPRSTAMWRRRSTTPPPPSPRRSNVGCCLTPRT